MIINNPPQIRANFKYTTFFCRFQDVEEESNVDLETHTDNPTDREQNNNSMFQQNLEIPHDNSMVNSR